MKLVFQICSLLNDSLAYVILPCYLFCLNRMSDTSIAEYIIYWAGCVLCFAICLPTLVFSRNSIKSKDPFSVLDHPAEIVYLIAMNFYLLLKTRVFSEFESVVYLDIFDLALFLVLFLFTYFKQRYWKTELNIFYRCGLAVIAIFKLYGIVGMSQQMAFRKSSIQAEEATDIYDLKIESIHIIVPISLSIFCSALIVNRGKKVYFYNFLAKNVNIVRFQLCLVKYQELDILIKNPLQYDASMLSQEDERVYLYFQGLIIEHIKGCRNMSCFCVEHRRSKPTNIVLISMVCQRFTEDHRFVECLLLLYLMDLYWELNSVRNLLVMIKRSCKNSFERFKLFQLRQIIELTIQSIYEEKVRGNSISQMIDTIYEDLFVKLTWDMEDTALDIKYILELKNKYIHMMDCALWVVESTQKQFGDFINSREIRSGDLYRFNLKINKMNKKIKSIFHEQILTYQQIPTYIFAVLTFYFSCVRNEAVLSKKIFVEYKNRLKQW